MIIFKQKGFAHKTDNVERRLIVREQEVYLFYLHVLLSKKFANYIKFPNNTNFNIVLKADLIIHVCDKLTVCVDFYQ